MKKQALGLVLCTALLSACGGGGAETPTASPAPSPSPAATPTPVATPTPGQTVTTPGCAFGYTIEAPTQTTGTDPLLFNQWHLNNTGQLGTNGTVGEDIRVLSAWNTTKGSGVRVAVVDDAIETIHLDLQANVVPGISFNYSTNSNLPLPCSSDDDHGTRVAGIIAARDDNGIGVAGVAPRASLVGFNALARGLDADISDAFSRDSQNVTISNNSWGSPDRGFKESSDSLFSNAVDNALNNGRGGKGTIFVFPSGNGGLISLANTATISDNSNFDGYLNRRGIIVACATNGKGEQPSFGENGANNLVCAPGTGNSTLGIATTAIRGGYSSDFQGTSASAPVVSGVVALMMAANSNLTWRDVPIILAQTARKNAPGDSSWSGTGFGRYSHKFGFGVVDANAAVNAARTWASVGGSNQQISCGPYSESPNIAIPDATVAGMTTPLTRSLSATGCAITQIESVEVTVNAPNHTYSGDLRIRLISPSGSISELADDQTCGLGLSTSDDPCRQAYDNWRFHSVRHLGEPSAGSWQLQVTDMNNRDTGNLLSWSIRIYGR